VLGGTLAQKIGGKVLMLFGIAWTAALTLLLPVLTELGGFGAIFALRLLMGMGEVRIGKRCVLSIDTMTEFFRHPLGPVWILWRFSNGCEIERKRVKHAIDAVIAV